MKRFPLNSQQPPAKPPTSHPQKTTSSLLTRRNLLLLSGGSIAALSGLYWLRHAVLPKTKTPPPDLSGNSLIAGTRQYDFLALSRLLTSHQHLHSQTSARIYAALSTQNPDFPLRAAELVQFTQAHQIKAVDILVSILSNNAELTPLKTVLHQIVDAWYLGVVSDGARSKVIAYESALMFNQVRDVVGVPGYCPAAPGYWATQPIVLKLG